MAERTDTHADVRQKGAVYFHERDRKDPQAGLRGQPQDWRRNIIGTWSRLPGATGLLCWNKHPSPSQSLQALSDPFPVGNQATCRDFIYFSPTIIPSPDKRRYCRLHGLDKKLRQRSTVNCLRLYRTGITTWHLIWAHTTWVWGGVYWNHIIVFKKKKV